MTVLYDRVALIGLGLIASSMSHAIRRAGLAKTITGYARSSETRAIAQHYYDEELASGLRRYIRRHCLEAAKRWAAATTSLWGCCYRLILLPSKATTWWSKAWGLTACRAAALSPPIWTIVSP